MRRVGLIGLLIMLISAAVLAAAETEQKTPPAALPVAVVENARFNFPPALEGTEVRHDFVIRNTGEAPLLIENVKAG